VNTVLYQLS